MAAVSPDGRFISIGAFTADVKVWEVTNAKGGGIQGVEKVMQLKGHKVRKLGICREIQWQ